VKALILAGGFGTRLRPLTYTRPKHLLPIANRPHIEHVFDLLVRHGISDVVMLTSYLSELFEPVFDKARARGLNVEVTIEEEPLGTAGAFKNAESFVGEDAFLAFNGDVLTDVDLSDFIARHKSDKAEATIMLTPVDDPSRFGVVPTDGSGRVLGFIEKPPPDEAPTNLINAGVYLFEPSVLERIPPATVWSAERQLFPSLVSERARLFAHGTSAYWIDIGTPQSYLQSNIDALAGRYETEATSSAVDAVLTGNGSHIDPTAGIATSVLGGGVTVGANARVEESVLLPGVSVGSDARVIRSVLGENVSVRDGSIVEERALGDGEVA
jgi:mannose-1-phosphate guanylyltransferase